MDLSRTSSSIRITGLNNSMDDVRVEGYDALIPPMILQMEHPLNETSKETILEGRRNSINVINKKDDRLLVIVGPCSIHDTKAAVEYGKLLKTAIEKYKDDLLIIMRVYFEKPRTTVGWKGLVNDPHLNDSYDINTGLKVARKLLIDLTSMGIPAGCELLDTISPQFLGDMFSWGAIGARTTESQLHRELASGVSFPVGFKNGTNGNVNISLDAIMSAAHSHSFLGVTKLGLAAITKTRGNKNCHIILRGGTDGPNYKSEYIKKYSEQIKKADLNDSIMIDCSHGNSNKDHNNQILVCKDISEQLSQGNTSIVGVMIESNINPGKQSIPEHIEGENQPVIEKLKYGVSVTDACVSWEQTEPMLEMLADAVRKRRTRQ
ncbi:hypothetical protein BB559_000356 [Furculomyces boomerangus]|uniref:Phospho-2-dehydro-3-deoxyheptonate aldolase n=2 Tax=Harpellales TaxID=61421 RepID=A0A2T9Z5L7_9FUNG|nr:hypothetical protein BB559_000356 [Furculomyces boomerangus]PWA01664.1 hypothetical protein BB558_002231 [Smittium angustum]